MHDFINNIGVGIKETNKVRVFNNSVRKYFKYYFDLESVNSNHLLTIHVLITNKLENSNIKSNADEKSYILTSSNDLSIIK